VGHTLQVTALANEVWVKLDRQAHARYGSHQHFLAVAARAMRQILVDRARRRVALQHGGDTLRVTLVEDVTRASELHADVDLLALEDALVRFETRDPRGAEIVELRFFGGLTESEVAKHLNLSRRTVTREWRLAKTWLAEALAE
jgi:RNA polymerase sigma factor (TIGR02999 family)